MNLEGINHIVQGIDVKPVDFKKRLGAKMPLDSCKKYMRKKGRSFWEENKS